MDQQSQLKNEQTEVVGQHVAWPSQPPEDFISATAQPGSQYVEQQANSLASENTDKDYIGAVMLSYFVGSLGIDRIYLGYIGTGVLKLVTFGGLGIWQFIDIILITFDKLHAKDDPRPLGGYAKNQQWAKIVVVILSVLPMLVILLLLVFVIIFRNSY